MRRRQSPSAFTLIELMISIAIVVVLMLGITKVFSLTSQTAGATNQMSSAQRDAQAALASFSQDFSNAVGDGSPFMIIHSETMPAFRNKADRDSDHDWAVGTGTAQWNATLSVDLNANNSDNDAGELISPATYNYRNHRIDTISFFTRHRFEKQTGGVGNTRELISQMNANEAWVWYGHLWLPGSNGWPAPVNGTTPSVTFPGQWDMTNTTTDPLASNPYNYYAADWVLGREAMLLQEPKYFVDSGTINMAGTYGSSYKSGATGGANKGIQDLSYVPQQFFYHSNVSGYEFSPFQAGSPDAAVMTGPGVADLSTATTTPNTIHLEDARYDLAGTSIDSYRIYLLNYLKSFPAVLWWQGMMCNDVIPIPGGGFTGGRFKANPFATGADPQSLAAQSPIFLRGCTQFIVEYAGDFIAQDTNQYLSSGAVNPTYGQITNAYFNADPLTPSTDGQIDFVVASDGSRHIRWYGMPRDTSGDGLIPGWNGGTRKTTDLVDVVPLRDVLFTVKNSTASKAAGASADVSTTLQSLMGGTLQSAPFERVIPNVPSTGDYTTDINFIPGETDTFAWGPTDPKPKMIRILITLDDPNGKLRDGQTFEYVFNLP